MNKRAHKKTVGLDPPKEWLVSVGLKKRCKLLRSRNFILSRNSSHKIVIV